MINYIHKCIITALVIYSYNIQAQDSTYARHIIKTLTSPAYSGRGYVDQGDLKAAQFIASEYSKIGLQSFGENYFQEFAFPVNRFPYELNLSVDGKKLKGGTDYILSPDCPPARGEYKVMLIDSEQVDNPSRWKQILKKKKRWTLIVINREQLKNVINKDRYNIIINNQFKAGGIVFIEKKFTWSVATRQATYPVIYMKPEIFDRYRYHIDLEIEPLFTKGYATQNVIGYIKGTTIPDSFIVLTAHYDHLGKMGTDAYFPGANDNASGVAMLLDMAKTYSKIKNKYSILFICFAGEEAGLIGSLYYTEKPFFPLNKIKFLLNLDLMGTGDKGATVVNGSVYKKEFDTLVYINSVLGYLPTINIRGKAANSDHYWFTEKGVPSFFIYLMGDYTFYHDVDDTNEALPLSKYNQSFMLLNRFVKYLDQ